MACPGWDFLWIDLKKTQMELSELKNTLFNVNNTLDDIINRLDTTKLKISEVEGSAIETI